MRLALVLKGNCFGGGEGARTPDLVGAMRGRRSPETLINRASPLHSALLPRRPPSRFLPLLPDSSPSVVSGWSAWGLFLSLLCPMPLDGRAVPPNHVRYPALIVPVDRLRRVGHPRAPAIIVPDHIFFSNFFESGYLIQPTFESAVGVLVITPVEPERQSELCWVTIDCLRWTWLEI